MYSLPVDVFIMRNDNIIHKDFTFDSGYQQSFFRYMPEIGYLHSIHDSIPSQELLEHHSMTCL